LGCSAGCECEVDRLDVFVRRVGMAMRAADAAGLGTGPQRLVDDCLDRAGAATAFGATAETAINLLGISCQGPAGAYGVADIVVAEDVTGTDDHQSKAGPWVTLFLSILIAPRVCKRKKRFLKQFQTDAGFILE
jgi:hypothetical protein